MGCSSLCKKLEVDKHPTNSSEKQKHANFENPASLTRAWTIEHGRHLAEGEMILHFPVLPIAPFV